MVSFYPGPSRVDDKVPSYIKDAMQEGVLSMNHRSPQFIALCKKTVSILKRNLEIPRDYVVLFTSSATECWEIIAQSLVTNAGLHIYNGAFGEKWFAYAKKIKSASTAIAFDPEVHPRSLAVSYPEAELICITQNETSNGTFIDNKTISALRKKNAHALLAVDVTSSLGGVRLKFSDADVWLASVQKCFGLPAGLGIMILSPQAVAKAKAVNDAGFYNSLPFMLRMMDEWQTSFTPNVLAIYLLMRTQEARPSIRKINNIIDERFTQWEKFFEGSVTLKLLIKNREVRSHTVLAITATPDAITAAKKKAAKKGFLLGEGYGTLKSTSLRIANFPALREGEIRKLQKVLKNLR